MKKSDINPLPEFFDRYIIPVKELELKEALVNATQELLDFDCEKWSRKAHFSYAEGKWTVLEVLQHMLDNERIQAARAMRFSRKDKSVLPGYDENLLSQFSEAKNREVSEIMEEYILLRKSNILMFLSMSRTQLLEIGIANKVAINALALGFQLVGHQRHHMNVLEERYT